MFVLSKGSYDGVDLEFLRLMAERLNFTLELLDSPDGHYGTKLPNGSFTGMIGQVMKMLK